MKNLYWWYFEQRNDIYHPDEVLYWHLRCPMKYYEWHRVVHEYFCGTTNLHTIAKKFDSNPERIRQRIRRFVRERRTRKFIVNFNRQYEELTLGLTFDLNNKKYWGMDIHFLLFNICITYLRGSK